MINIDNLNFLLYAMYHCLKRKSRSFFGKKITALFLISVINLISLESASQVDGYMPKPKENPIER